MGIVSKSCSGKASAKIVSKLSKGKKRPNATGNKNHNWKGGMGTIQSALRSSIENKAWILDVYRRDGFTCRRCGSSKSNSLIVHHLTGLSQLVKDNNITKDNFIMTILTVRICLLVKRVFINLWRMNKWL